LSAKCINIGEQTAARSGRRPRNGSRPWPDCLAGTGRRAVLLGPSAPIGAVVARQERVAETDEYRSGLALPREATERRVKLTSDCTIAKEFLTR